MRVNISVVIASIGENELFSSINSLLGGTITPKEIIIVFPKGVQLDPLLFSNSDIKIITTTELGQVKQRLIGISHAKGEYILQSDSRIFWTTSALEKLYNEALNSDKMNVFSPRTIETDEIEPTILNDFIEKIDTRTLDTNTNETSIFRKSGFIRSPYCYDLGMKVLHRSEWINGICLYHRSLAAKCNYYPFEGKAYCEDVLNSMRLIKLGAKLWIRNDAEVFTPTRFYTATFRQLTGQTRVIYRVLSIFVEKKLQYTFLFNLFFLVWWIKVCCRIVIKKFT